MRRRLGRAGALAVAASTLAGAADPARAQAGAAAAAPAGSVAAAFLSLPSGYVDLPPAERRRLLSAGGRRLIARDNRNGYLAIGGDGASPGFTVTVFRSVAGEPVVAVQRFDELRRRTWFLRRRGLGWEDVSARIVPGYAPERRYTLPRYGVTLVADGAPLAWKDGRFVPAPGAAATGPAGAIPFAGTWKVTAVRLGPAKVQALQPNDPAYMGAVLDATPQRLAWKVKPKGGTLDDVCQGPKLENGAVKCVSGAFGPPPGAHVTLKPAELDLDWYDGAELSLHKVGG